MKFLTDVQKEQLLKNGSEDNRDQDHAPIVKLFIPNTNAIWLLSEIEPANPTIAFGLCDLGLGFPELGYVDLEELNEILIAGTFQVEQDYSFKPQYPMSIYAHTARMERFITTKEEMLSVAALEIQKPDIAPKP